MQKPYLIPAALYNGDPVLDDRHCIGVRLGQDGVRQRHGVVPVPLLVLQLGYEPLVVLQLQRRLRLRLGQLAGEP